MPPPMIPESESLVERVARAICPHKGCVRYVDGKRRLCVDEFGRNIPCEGTRDQLILSGVWATSEDALRACLEPTEKMIGEGKQELRAWHVGDDPMGAKANSIFRAMLLSELEP